MNPVGKARDRPLGELSVRCQTFCVWGSRFEKLKVSLKVVRERHCHLINRLLPVRDLRSFRA